MKTLFAAIFVIVVLVAVALAAPDPGPGPNPGPGPDPNPEAKPFFPLWWSDSTAPLLGLQLIASEPGLPFAKLIPCIYIGQGAVA